MGRNWRNLRKRALKLVALPFLIAATLALIYIVELYLAGSLDYGAAYGYVMNLSDRYDPLIRFVAPFLHSNHDHIAWNLGYFLLLSPLILSHEHPRDYLIIFLISCWFTASVGPWLLGGGIGFGISGGNAALGGWEAIYRIREWLHALREAPMSLRYVKAGILILLPITLTVNMIGQGLGFVEVGPGVSVAGHFLGAVFGIVYGLFLLFQDSKNRIASRLSPR